MVDVSALCDDLRAESGDLDHLVADLADEQWGLETPAPGWTIAHQIGHLTWTDEVAAAAIAEPIRFTDEIMAGVIAAVSTGIDPVDEAAAAQAQQAPPDLLAAWRAARSRLDVALRRASRTEPTRPVPWFGPPMSLASMATARLMETWAHGQDVADTLAITRTPTARLRHIAHLGVRTRNFAYAARGHTPPADTFRVDVVGPDGEIWSFGPEDATESIGGPALDFCLLVTQRRHRDDLALIAQGAEADRWLDIAQAFAGPPGVGRAPIGAGQAPTGAGQAPTGAGQAPTGHRQPEAGPPSSLVPGLGESS